MHCIHVAIRPSSGCSRSGGTLAGELSTRGGSKFAEAWHGRTFLIQFPRLRPPSFFEILPSPLTVSVLTLLRLFPTKKICKENISRGIVFREVVEGAVEGDAMILIYLPLPPPSLFNFSFLRASNFSGKIFRKRKTVIRNDIFLFLIFPVFLRDKEYVTILIPLLFCF